jgi:Transposase DDE domain
MTMSTTTSDAPARKRTTYTPLARGKKVPAGIEAVHPAKNLIPRGSRRWQALYSTRTAAERCFSRLKHGFGLLDLRLRGRERVSFHADLAMIALLCLALVQARAAP